ncbi:MAG: hypothetical protein OXF27_11760 [Acidobacteria bacterium]|nr:hypothetical protein [Acidobacteriota bacterium]
MAAGDLYLAGGTRDRVYRRAGGYGGAAWDAGIVVPTGGQNTISIAVDAAGELHLVVGTRGRL